MKKLLTLLMLLFLVGCTSTDEVTEEVVEEPVEEVVEEETEEVEEPVEEEPIEEIVEEEVVVELDEEAPVISIIRGSETEYRLGGTAPNWLDLIKVTDNEEVAEISVVEDGVDFTAVGTYNVVYKAVDTSGNEALFTAEIDVIALEMEFKSGLPLIDESENYTLDIEVLNTYASTWHEEVTYVNIEELFAFAAGSLVEDLFVEKGEHLVIGFEVEQDPEYLEPGDDIMYSYLLTIDAEENTLHYNDIDMFNAINTYPEVDYSQGLEVIRFEDFDVDFSRTIDLDDYEIDIVLFEDNYYIPLYMTNPFLTGDGVSFYELKDSVIMFDTQTETSALEKIFAQQRARTSTSLADETENFLALHIDYLYGLKEFEGITDTYAELEAYDIDDQTTVEGIQDSTYDMFNDWDDLHTYLVTGGVNNMNFDPPNNNSEGSNYSKLVQAYVYDNECNSFSANVTRQTYGDTLYIIIKGFSLELPQELEDVMYDADQYENIVFDLRCNLGGLVTSAIHLLTYMTDDEIPVNWGDTYTGYRYTLYYKSIESNYIDANYYVITSNATFSAANLVASQVKDMGIATLLGDYSLGGACAIQYLITPEGTIYSTSSTNGFYNMDGVLIEAGITPHVYIEHDRNTDYINLVLDEINK